MEEKVKMCKAIDLLVSDGERRRKLINFWDRIGKENRYRGLCGPYFFFRLLPILVE